MTLCANCAKELAPHKSPGRPKTYCDIDCREKARFRAARAKRWKNFLAYLESRDARPAGLTDEQWERQVLEARNRLTYT